MFAIDGHARQSQLASETEKSHERLRHSTSERTAGKKHPASFPVTVGALVHRACDCACGVHVTTPVTEPVLCLTCQPSPKNRSRISEQP